VFLDCQDKCQAFVLASKGAMVSNMRLYRFSGATWYIANSGGISLFGCGTVTNCHFDGNLLNGYTGAKAIRNRCGIVRDCTFERCVGRDSYADADGAGNGVLIQHGKIALTENCIFTNNGVNAGGTAWGQVYIHDGIFRNCQISDNSITATTTFSTTNVATGVRIRGGLIENCTIARNRAMGPVQPFAAGVVHSGGTVRNCLMVDNASASAVDEPVDWLSNTPASFVNCAAASVDGTQLGVAVTAAAYVWKDNFLRLTPLSPAINAGVTAEWMTGATDLLGKPRVMGSSVDIGAIEFDPNALAVDFSCGSYEAIDEYSATLTAIINGDTTGLVVVWDLDGDGVYETSGVSVEFLLDKAGQTIVSVKATNNGGEEATCSHMFTVYPNTLYVVSQNPSAAAPYTNWKTAAATIADAIALAGNGSAIIVSNGTYAINSQILLTRAIDLRGLTGDFNDVIVDAQNKCRALKVAAAGASVSGITFKRGMEGSVSGAYVYGGSVSNCRFTANHVRNLGGASDYWQIATLACDKGTLVDCVVDASDFHEMYRTQRSFGHIYLLGGAFAERCVVTNNYNTGHNNTGGSLGKSGSTGVYISNGTLRNSLVARNRMLKPNSQDPNIIGGGAYLNAGRIDNCTIVTNTIVENTNLTYYAYYALYNHNGTVMNTIVADHWALESAANPGTAYPCGYATGVFTNSCLPGAAELPGAKNIESVGATTYAFGSDGRLLFPFPLSPCQNKGLNEPWMTDAVDLYGNKRIFGPRVDIGCLECQRSAGFMFMIR
jgi:hypothetical protein